jgi:hypothetical protein
MGKTGRRGWPLYLLGGLLVVALLVLLVLLLRRSETAPASPFDAGVRARPADRGASPDLPGADAAVDRTRPRPRPTRIVTQPEVRALQVRHRALLNACYDIASRRAPATVASRVDVTAVLADGGAVRSVRVEGTDDRSLIRCLRASVKSWRFSSGLRAQEVSFPIIFGARR